VIGTLVELTMLFAMLHRPAFDCVAASVERCTDAHPSPCRDDREIDKHRLAVTGLTALST
jgi:hypothetical protein